LNLSLLFRAQICSEKALTTVPDCISHRTGSLAMRKRDISALFVIASFIGVAIFGFSSGQIIIKPNAAAKTIYQSMISSAVRAIS
jgi:hypothetical protein